MAVTLFEMILPMIGNCRRKTSGNSSDRTKSKENGSKLSIAKPKLLKLEIKYFVFARNNIIVPGRSSNTNDIVRVILLHYVGNVIVDLDNPVALVIVSIPPYPRDTLSLAAHTLGRVDQGIPKL